MIRVTTVSLRLATVSVDTLDRRHTCQQTLSGMADPSQQQPGDGIRIQRVDAGHSLARNFAAIFQLPGRAGGMLTDDLILPIAKLCLGRLERPTEFAVRPGLARIDL